MKKVTFLNDNVEKNLLDAARQSLESVREDLDGFFSEGDYDSFYEYGLSFDNELQALGYWSYVISTGGPHTEVRFHGQKGMIEFVYKDWFSGCGFDVTEDEVFQRLQEEFIQLGMME